MIASILRAGETKMDKRLFILITGVLAIVVITTGVLYAREKENVSTLEAELTGSKAEASGAFGPLLLAKTEFIGTMVVKKFSVKI